MTLIKYTNHLLGVSWSSIGSSFVIFYSKYTNFLVFTLIYYLFAWKTERIIIIIINLKYEIISFRAINIFGYIFERKLWTLYFLLRIKEFSALTLTVINAKLTFQTLNCTFLSYLITHVCFRIGTIIKCKYNTLSCLNYLLKWIVKGQKFLIKLIRLFVNIKHNVMLVCKQLPFRLFAE